MPNYEPILAPVYPSIGFDELGRLLREAGYDIEAIAQNPRPAYRMLTKPGFTIELTTPFNLRPGEYGVIHLWARMPLPPRILADVLREMPLQCGFAHLLTDQRGNLVMCQHVVVAGGITAHYLRAQFWYWRKDLEQVCQEVRRSLAPSTGWRLH
ncbi:MAG: hypothetical protein WAW79_11960 [Steroidobacteraceae bacterium]